MTKEFKGADWSKYNPSEFKWVEIILTKKILKKSDLKFLLEKFKIKFEDNKIKSEEIGSVLINDVNKEFLIPEIERILKEKYPNLINRKEALEIKKKLENIENKKLINTILEITKNSNYKKIIEDKEFLNKVEGLKEFLKDILLEEFYRIDKSEVYKILKDI